MSLNQYEVYQIKPGVETRPLRYKSYGYLLENHIPVDADNYRQVYLATMVKEASPDEIRRQLEKKLPRSSWERP